MSEVTSGVTRIFVGNYYEVQAGTPKKYYYHGATRVAENNGGTLYFLLDDHLGSTAITTNASGGRVTELRYLPYGYQRHNPGSQITSYRYTGQRWDSGTGLYYYGARWYDPVVGRFLQADTIVPDPGDPQSLNRYAYVLNNPLRYTDPTGHAQECGTHAGTSCGGVGPLWPVVVAQAPPEALKNVWAVTETVAVVAASAILVPAVGGAAWAAVQTGWPWLAEALGLLARMETAPMKPEKQGKVPFRSSDSRCMQFNECWGAE